MYLKIRNDTLTNIMITYYGANVNKNRSTKNDKITRKLAFRTKSAIKAQVKTKRIFLIFTVLVYIAIV